MLWWERRSRSTGTILTTSPSEFPPSSPVIASAASTPASSRKYRFFFHFLPRTKYLISSRHLKRNWELNLQPSKMVDWFVNEWRRRADQLGPIVEKRVDVIKPGWNSYVKALMPTESIHLFTFEGDICQNVVYFSRRV